MVSSSVVDPDGVDIVVEWRNIVRSDSVSDTHWLASLYDCATASIKQGNPSVVPNME